MPSAALAVSGSAVINELMYHPASDLDEDEFLELHNPGDDPFDLSGMCFVGITLCFDPGTSLAGHSYAIVSPSIAQSQTTYGVTPIAVYTAKLSNGGELVQLLDGATAVDEVEYIDGAPWPLSPDGGGPSLELIDPATNNNLASSWAASTGNLGTAGAQNSVFGVDPPEQIDNAAISPAAPSAADPVVVSAEMAAGLTAELTYKVMFGSDVAVVMFDDGLSGDGAADDGVYGATIPAQSDGKLIRYRIDITSGGDGAFPAVDDSIGYVGYVVADPDVATSLPVFQWFIPPAAYTDMIENHRFDDVEVPGVLAHDGVVYDGVTFRIRGGSRSRSQPKPNFKVEMPAGHDLVAPGLLVGPVDEFVIQSEYKDLSKGRAHTGWVAFDEAGFPHLDQFFLRMEQNRDFYGIYRFQQTYDGNWRDRMGLDTGSLYKADGASWESPNTRFDKKNPDGDDNTEIVQLAAVLDNAPSASKTRYLYDNVDVPNMINYMATASLLRHFDHHGQNNYVYRTEEGRWGMLPWDLDQVWPQTDVRCGSDPYLTPACVTNLFEDAMLEVPEFRDMHFRRLRTLIDELLTSGLLDDEYTQLLADIALDDPLEAARWSRPTAASRAYQLRDDIDARKAIFNDAIADGIIPPSQVAVPPVVINELHYNPVDDGVEFLELFNWGSVSVDMSGWSIPGASLQIPPGTVILPGAYVVFTEDDVAFKALYGSGTFVADQYGGGLGGGGELIELLDANANVIDLVEYDDKDPWPETPDGSGPSLELFDPLLDNTLPNAWFPSLAFGGSPGEVNDPNTTGLPPPPPPPADVTYVDFGDVWKYLDNGSNQGTSWRNPSFNDSAWSSGPAELGYGDGDEATVVASGAPDKYITTYFRSSFVVGNPSLVLDMRGSLIRDDGAVVYVNGTEVFRTNMPGSFNYSTRASSGVSGAAEDLAVAFTVPVGLLSSGVNTVAVEIHQRGSGSSDISFDVELVGLTIQDTDTEAPTSADPVTLTATGSSTMAVSWATSTDDSGTVIYDVLRTGAGLVATTSSTTFDDSGLTASTEYEYVVEARDPSGNTTASTPVSEFTDPDTTPPTNPGSLAATATGSATIQVSWAASVDEGPVTYRVRQDGVFLADTSATSLTASGLDPETEYGYEVRAWDGAGNSSELVGPVFATTEAENVDPVLIPAGSGWSYLDDGSNQGTAWRASGFNDSSWDTGAAELGYGDGGETTVVNGGPVGSRFITTYFRRDFTVGDPGAYAELELRLKRDDGAVVYVNGTEVVRSNMPGGTIGYTTRAATGVAGGAEGAFNTFTVPASVLVSGVNVVAVEIHQRSPQSSDISFDLSLEGVR